MKRLAFALLLPFLMLLSCATTSTYWVPVYTMKAADAHETVRFDPVTKAITDPEDGTAFAYYKGESAGSIVYGSDYSMSLAKKIVLKGNTIDATESTAQPTSNLSITKFFSYDDALPAPSNAAELLAKAGINYKDAGPYAKPEDVYKRDLYIQKAHNLLVFDQRLLQDGQIVEYVISGLNAGTDSIKDVVVLDVIPAGFSLVEAGYWFSNASVQASGQNETASYFEQKNVSDGGKTALVFKGRLSEPLKPGDEFRIRVKVALDLKSLDRQFTNE